MIFVRLAPGTYGRGGPAKGAWPLGTLRWYPSRLISRKCKVTVILHRTRLHTGIRRRSARSSDIWLRSAPADFSGPLHALPMGVGDLVWGQAEMAGEFGD